VVRRWNDGCAVFDLVTGNSHTLDEIACAVFRATIDRELDLAAMLQLIESDLPGLSSDEFAKRVQFARNALVDGRLLGTPVMHD
jgi:hypothetical protein